MAEKTDREIINSIYQHSLKIESAVGELKNGQIMIEGKIDRVENQVSDLKKDFDALDIKHDKTNDLAVRSDERQIMLENSFKEHKEKQEDKENKLYDNVRSIAERTSDTKLLKFQVKIWLSLVASIGGAIMGLISVFLAKKLI